MATKDYCLSLKDKQNFVDTSNNQYSNLNLNHSHHFSSVDTVSSKNDKIDNRKLSKNDFTDSNDSKARKNLNSWKKSTSNLLNIHQHDVDRDEKEIKDRNNANPVNSSTLSLHIAAYENSNEATSDASEASFNEGSDGLKNQRKQTGKSWKNAKHIFGGQPSSSIQNLFEFPRQQKNVGVTEPEVLQFTASQRLLNPNQMNASSDNVVQDGNDAIIDPFVQQNNDNQLSQPIQSAAAAGNNTASSTTTMADIIVHEIQHKNVKIACKAGNITRSTAEVALVSSTPQYPMDVGASKAIALAGGQTFHERRLVAIDYARNNDESYITIDTEDIVEIPFKYVIVIPVRGRNRSSMRVIYRQAIKAAIDSEMSSVVMPLLGWGLNIQVNRATQELLEAILTFSSFGNLTAISFIDINVQSMERLGQLFDTIPSMLPDPGPSYGVHPAPAYIPDLPSQSVSTGLSDITVISATIRSGPAPIVRTEVQFVGTSSAPPVKEEDNIVKEEIPFTEIPRNEVGNHHTDLNSTQSFPCSICLCDLVGSASNGEEDAASLEKDPVVRMKMCTHEFHKSCIETCFETKKRCPLCMRWYAPSFGNQPLNSVMRVKRTVGNPPGHPNADGWFNIKYIIPGGIQNANHLRPGVPFSGTTRTAWIPNDEGGRHVLSLLRKAFDHRHIFTIGDSITTGVHNVPVWVIHHKTSQTGGPPNYGFPDPGYYERVIEELGTVGITRETLDLH